MKKAPSWPFKIRSLALRVVTLSTVWVIIALIVVATLISSLYKEAAERNFRSLLTAHLYSLISAVGVDDAGKLTGRPELGEIRYSSYGSGWYWDVTPVSENLSGDLKSTSVGLIQIEEPALSVLPFDGTFKRSYAASGIKGEELYIVETEVVLDDENRVARFRIMGNLSEVKAEVADFKGQLYTYLVLFGIGSVMINAAVILFGLRPLDRVRRSLTNIREGRSTKIEGDLPVEIAPLGQELNALIENNRRIVERSRTQVGNLAHSLKTPLSVMINEAAQVKGEKGRLLQEQCSSMQLQIQHYLQRARIAAQRDSVVFRTPVMPLAERMVRVTEKLNRDKEIRFNFDGDDLIFAGEKEDFEEVLGNLMENAGKWGKSIIQLTIGPSAEKTDYLELIVEDDGQGLPQDKLAEALKRGGRVDENKPGTGLGLSIVQDTVREYGGTFKLGKSKLGGLAAIVTMPLAEK